MPQAQTTSALFAQQTGELRRGPRLGRGGEGEVFEVAGQPTLAVKLYHNAVAAERLEKIRAMQDMASDELASIAAWPIDLVLENNKPVGFLMPRAKGGKEIHTLYGPKSRKREFPDAGFAFLVHAAANLALAFAVVHERGLVVGDVNDRFAMVAHDATVMLIDCDSFQVGSSKRIFPCEVGVPTFTPPELQTVKSFRGVTRTANHDNFGLAVLLFHLLFLGRHPFAGRPQDGDDPAIENAIKAHRFAYATDIARTRMQPPPNTLRPSAASDHIAELFERAFAPEASSDNNPRPTALDWVSALENLQAALQPCSDNRAHAFHRSLAACPWCALEARTGLELFNYIPPPNAAPSIDVDTIWAALTGLSVPEVPPLSRLMPKEGFTPDKDAELIFEMTRRKASLQQASETRARLEQDEAKIKEGLEDAVQAERSAVAHAEAFDADVERLDDLHQRLRLSEREARRQSLWGLLVLINVGVIALLLAYGSVWQSGAACLSLVIIYGLSRLSHIGIKNPRDLRNEITALEMSIARGPQARLDAATEAGQVRASVERSLGQAQATVYKAMTAETEARSKVNDVQPAASEAGDRHRKKISAAERSRKKLEVRRAELVDMHDRLDAHRAQRLKALEATKWDLVDIAKRQKKAFDDLKRREREKQLARYLDQFFLVDARLPGIGPNLTATLASFGVETAADIDKKRVRPIPGFGKARTRTLLDWRRQKEKGFRFVSGQLDPAQRAALERKYATERRRQERLLQLGINDLQSSIGEFQAEVTQFTDAAKSQSVAIAEAEYQAAVASGRVRGRPW